MKSPQPDLLARARGMCPQANGLTRESELLQWACDEIDRLNACLETFVIDLRGCGYSVSVHVVR